MLPKFLRRNSKMRKTLMPPPSDYVYINNATCPKRPDRGTQYEITLAGIEAQILHREGLMVKFLRQDDNQTLKPHWVEGGHPRLGYSWEQRLPDKATLDAFHKRMQRDVPGLHYMIIGLDGTTVRHQALESSRNTVAKKITMGLMRVGYAGLTTAQQKTAMRGVRGLASDAVLDIPPAMLERRQ
jgi:hypothetical protein